MPSPLQSRIHEILAAALAEVASAVRRDVSTEVQKVLDGQLPQSGSRAAVTAEKSSAPISPRALNKGTRGSKGGKAARVSDSEQDVVLSVLAKRPGLTSLQVQREAGIDAQQAGRVLLKLRKTGRVRWQGQRSAAIYTVA